MRFQCKLMAIVFYFFLVFIWDILLGENSLYVRLFILVTLKSKCNIRLSIRTKYPIFQNMLCKWSFNSITVERAMICLIQNKPGFWKWSNRTFGYILIYNKISLKINEHNRHLYKNRRLSTIVVNFWTLLVYSIVQKLLVSQSRIFGMSFLRW